jgi:hypothetical protein
MNVLDFDCRLIDEHTNRKSQSSQGHYVDRLSSAPQKHDRRKQRERDVHHNNERAPPIVKENQHHETGKHRSQ